MGSSPAGKVVSVVASDSSSAPRLPETALSCPLSSVSQSAIALPRQLLPNHSLCVCVSVSRLLSLSVSVSVSLCVVASSSSREHLELLSCVHPRLSMDTGGLAQGDQFLWSWKWSWNRSNSSAEATVRAHVQ